MGLRIRLCLSIAICALPQFVRAQEIPRLDFRDAALVRQWRPTHDLSAVTSTPDGMKLTISGGDPYSIGTAHDFPAGQPLWFKVRLKSETAGQGELFYSSPDHPWGPENAIHFPVRANRWEEIRVPLNPLWRGTRLRFDPPGTRGSCTIASMEFESRTLLKQPTWLRPAEGTNRKGSMVLRSGDLTLLHGPRQLGEFTLTYRQTKMAIGHNRPQIGYIYGASTRWIAIPPNAKVVRNGERILVVAHAKDPDGATWSIRQAFSVRKSALDVIDVDTEITVSRQRNVIYAPILLIHPGVGSFGTAKKQALFAGLEYLDSHPTEVSSSEADMKGEQAGRLVPDLLKITMPLMAVHAEQKFIALTWDRSDTVSPIFDVPDRVFKSGGHLMGHIFPASNGINREEGQILPYDGEWVGPTTSVRLRSTLFAGNGSSAADAVKRFVALKGLPPIPKRTVEKSDYVGMTAAGWLDSKVAMGGLFRHSYWPGVEGPVAHAAGDAAVWMEWLAIHTQNPAQATRLREAERMAVSRLTATTMNFQNVGHIVYPLASLVFGEVEANAKTAGQNARRSLGKFQTDGTLPYRQSANGLDYGSTHYEPDANGLTAAAVKNLLEGAVLSGEADLVREAMRRLRGLDRFVTRVPRGAQTWEVPLHTPDILASAHLLRAYTLGYEISGDPKLLEHAKYWAWTGVPFIYLRDPTDQAVGTYATIPVLGATQWIAPNWIGLPVQWCGLVYADALYRFLKYDPKGPWKQLADGITQSGIEQSFPIGEEPELQGLLPDSFGLRAQSRNAVAINPATVQACAVRLFGNLPGSGPLAAYDFQSLRKSGLFVHAPGNITEVVDGAARVGFHVKSWLDRPYYVLVSGFKSKPEVNLFGGKHAEDAIQFSPETGRLVLKLEGATTVEISQSRQ